VRRFLFWSFAALFSLTLAAALGVGWLYWRYADELPDHRFLLSKDAEPEACGATESRSKFIPLQEIPANVIKAYVAHEDIEFYTRPKFTALTFVVWLSRQKGRRARHNDWASQFTHYAIDVVNFRKDPSRTLRTNGTEKILLAYRIERDIPKEVILERFVNCVPRDRKSIGLGGIAQLYFHKRLNELSLAEAAFMANTSLSSQGYYLEGDRPPDSYLKPSIRYRNFLLDRMAP
jgi:membrane carboxypeptidase/penicillin-binding protein